MASTQTAKDESVTEKGKKTLRQFFHFYEGRKLNEKKPTCIHGALKDAWRF